MTAPAHFRSRRRRFAARAHEMESRRPPVDDGKVVWYRGPDGDHAFGVSTGYLRSKCREVRFTVLMRVVEGTVNACAACLAAIAPTAPLPRPLAPLSPLEDRAGNGDR